MESATLSTLPVKSEAAFSKPSPFCVTPLLAVGRVIDVHDQILLTNTRLRGVGTIILTNPAGSLLEAIRRISIGRSSRT